MQWQLSFYLGDKRLQPVAKFAIMRAASDEDKKLMAEKSDLNALSGRFRGFYPVVIDVETAGFNAKTDALLEIAAVTLKMDEGVVAAG